MRTMADPIALLDLTQPELADLLAGWGQPRYRAGQVWDWLYKKLAADPAEMTNLPKDLRERLAIATRFNPLERVYEQRSSDGQTVKWLFRLPDGLTIETVLMLYDDVSGSAKDRRTVCISTQAGCAMGCVFCATGQAGLARNLTTGEIVAQVLAAARWLTHSDEGPTTNDETPPGVRPSSFVHSSVSPISSSWAWASRWRTTIKRGRRCARSPTRRPSAWARGTSRSPPSGCRKASARWPANRSRSTWL